MLEKANKGGNYMYDKHSMKATEFIDDGEILDTIAWAEENKDN